MASPTNRAVIGLLSSSHKLAYRLTGGGLGGKIWGAPVLLLTTTGRKSGKRRTAPILYLAEGENLVLVASNGGSDRQPGWYLNLRRQPVASVQVGSSVRAVRAEVAPPEEKRRLWPALNAMYSEYACYQERTARDIPVVILKPAQVTTPA